MAGVAEVAVDMTTDDTDPYDLEASLKQGEEALYTNALSWGCREYLGHSEGLEPVLYLEELQY